MQGVLKFERIVPISGQAKTCSHDIDFTASRVVRQLRSSGSTGSGKSTLVNLIPRFYDVTEGSITLDGIGISAI